MRSWGSTEVYGAALFALLGLILFATVKGCASIGAPDDYHYRMTVYVGDRAYSGVRDVQFSSDLSLEGLRRQHYHRVDGEAIPIIVSNRPIYFALLDAEKIAPEFVALRSSARRLIPDKRDVDWSDIAKVEGEHDLPRQVRNRDISDSPYNRDYITKTWPEFVAFDDAKNPKTRRSVTPDAIGVTRITVEITNDPAEKRIASIYPALTKVLWMRY